MSERWPFSDEKMTASITLISVAHEGSPVLYAEHSWDGSWLFLDGKPDPSMDDVLTVGLVEAVEMDPALREVAALPVGFFAARETPEAPWQVGYTGDPEEDEAE